MTSFPEDETQPDSDELYEDEDAEGGPNVIDGEPESAAVPGQASADLEELVRFVAAKLVQNPEEVVVESELRSGTVYVSLRVPEEEMGRVIGREGRTAKAIRTLVSIAGSRHNVHARLDIDG